MVDNDINININNDININDDIDEFPEDLDFEQHLVNNLPPEPRVVIIDSDARAELEKYLATAKADLEAELHDDDDDDDDDPEADDMFDFYAHGCYHSVRVADIMNPVARVHPFLGQSGVFVGWIVSTAHSLLAPTSIPAHTIHWRSYDLHSSMLAKHRQQPTLAITNTNTHINKQE
jgi:hypothetical protein